MEQLNKDDIVIEVSHINKSFQGYEVLRDVSLKVPRGKIYGIIGRNGSGKSVLFKCICGLMMVDDGEILINGYNSFKTKRVSKYLGFIIEEPGFLPQYSGYQNLKMLAYLQSDIGKNEINEILKLVELKEDANKKVGKYSMGMKQRLAIAQAIMERPPILILDEPMNGLDNLGVASMRKLFLDLKEQGNTILLASHMREDIMILCDEVYEMEDGMLHNCIQTL